MTVPGPNITITSRLLPDGEVATVQTRRVDAVDGIPQALANINALPCPRATACIYCGSTKQLSNEHVVPYALGGHLQILDGSCEVCRKRTSEFEDRLLNDGAMANIRKALGLQSRSKHKRATDTIDVILVRDETEYAERLPAESVPQVFGFPQFAPPHRLTGADARGITLQGWVAASTGPDVDTFLREHGEPRGFRSIRRSAAQPRTA